MNKYGIDVDNLNPLAVRYIALLILKDAEMEYVLLQIKPENIYHGYTSYGIIAVSLGINSDKFSLVPLMHKHTKNILKEFNIEITSSETYMLESTLMANTHKVNISEERILKLLYSLIAKLPAKQRTKDKIEYLKFIFTVK